MLSILQLDTDSQFAKQVRDQLASEGLKIQTVEIDTCKQLSAELQKKAYDLIFLSDNARDCSGVDALEMAQQLAVTTPVVVFSEILDEEIIVNFINLGATDFILKTGLHRLGEVVQRIMRDSAIRGNIDYQKFFKYAPDMLCCCDSEGQFTVINPAWEKTLGFDASDMIGKPFIQFVHPEDQKNAAAQFRKQFVDASNTSPNLVCRFQTKTGNIKWLHWNMIIESATTINAVVRDVTETRTREMQLAQAHGHLQKLVTHYKSELAKKTLVAEQIRDSVIVTNLKGLIVSWNKGSEKIFGYSAKEMVGQHIAVIYPEADYKYIQEGASNVLLEQGEKEFSLHMRRKSGEVFAARLKLEVTRDKNGTVNGMLGYAVDMGPVRSPADEPDTMSNDDQTNVELQTTGITLAAVTDPMQGATQQQTLYDMSVDNNNSPYQLVAANTVVEQPSVAQTRAEQTSADQPIPEPHNPVQHDNTAEQQITAEKVFVPRGDGSKVTIMYLEDSMNHIYQVEKALTTRKDYLLITTQEPEDCLDMAKQYLPAVILLDMDLPNRDGYDLFNALQATAALKHIPVIAVSADSSAAAINNTTHAGFSYYLTKPFDANRLLAAIDAILHTGNANAI